MYGVQLRCYKLVEKLLKPSEIFVYIGVMTLDFSCGQHCSADIPKSLYQTLIFCLLLVTVLY